MIEKPKKSRAVAREEFDRRGNYNEFLNYCQAQRNPFFQTMKLKEQNNICLVCNRQFKEAPQGHHTTYDHLCYTKETVRIKKENSKRIHGRPLPDCEKCFSEHPNCFKLCAERIVFLHANCHRYVHGRLPKSTDNVR